MDYKAYENFKNEFHFFHLLISDLSIFLLGTILGITNGFGNIPGWLAPLTAGAFTQGSVKNT